MAGYIGKDKVARAAVIYFKDGVSRAAAEKALRVIGDVLESGDDDPGRAVREYDIDYGHQYGTYHDVVISICIIRVGAHSEHPVL